MSDQIKDKATSHNVRERIRDHSSFFFLCKSYQKEKKKDCEVEAKHFGYWLEYITDFCFWPIMYYNLVKDSVDIH